MITCFVFRCSTPTEPADIPANPVIPTTRQVDYQQLELVGFIHFTINTFTDKEWGYGDESPELFNPSYLDTDQWARIASEAGMKELILTAKHHDGFCLWPSAYTDHSVRNSPYKNGNGDVVGEFIASCRKYGLKAGLYLSPWDRNHADYGTPAYLTYYRNQLQELLTNYGEINEIWFDGANGGDGYYGGAYEERRIDRATYYDWDSTFALVKELQPGISIFSDAGPDIHWIGNEHGFAAETFWSTIDASQLVIGASDPAYLNTGDPSGGEWILGQCDVSIRPGWFYHASQDSLVKTPDELLDIYYKSVGRNAVLLLNLPPDQRGRIHELDEASLRAFRAQLDQIFQQDLALDAVCNTNNQHTSFPADRLTDNDPSTYWAAENMDGPIELHVELDEALRFDHIVLEEPTWLGQRISRFEIDIATGNRWDQIAKGSTIGYKRILRFAPVRTSRIRIRILEANNVPALTGIHLYHAGITASSL